MPSINFGGSTIPARSDGKLVPILYSDVPSFMGLPIIYNKDELKVDAVILGIPYDGPCTFRGGNTRLAPSAIRKVSMLYLEHNWDTDISFTDYITVTDYGDVDVAFNEPMVTFNRAMKKILDIYEAGAVPIILGGDHSITIPAIWALSKWVGEAGKIGVIQFDTHVDLQGWPENPSLTRGGPMAQVLQQKNINPCNIVQFGVRGPRSRKGEEDIAKKVGTNIIKMTEIVEKGIEYCAEKAFNAATDGTDFLYVTLDIDVFDPAFAPGTNSPECFGLTSREVWQALKIVTKKGLNGFDFNELSPMYDNASGSSALLGARFCREVIDIIALQNAGK